MKIFKILLGVLAICIIVLGFLFSTAFKKYRAYKEDVRYKREQVSDAARYKQEAKSLSRELEKIRHEAALLEKRVPFHETKPLAAIKDITLLARQQGVTAFSFICQDTTASSRGQSSSPAAAVPSGPQMGPQFGPGPAFSGPAAQQPSLTDIVPMEFTMTCECDFGQLLHFLREISALPRLISVREISIIRDQAIIPRQKIVIGFTAYTFP